MSTEFSIKRLEKERCDYFPNNLRVKRHFALTNGPMSEFFENDQTPLKFKAGEKGFLMHAFCALANICPTCNACVPLRVNLDKFFTTKSQDKRIRKLGYDAHIFETAALSDVMLFQMFRKYAELRHAKSSMLTMDQKEFSLLTSRTPLCLTLTKTFPDAAQPKLYAYALMDTHNAAMSFDYAVYDPAILRDSPGKLLWLEAMRMAKERGIEHVYVGNWAKGSPKLDYKKQHVGLEAFVKDRWIDFNPDIHIQGPDYRALLRLEGYNL